jgi:hypothetical protein
MNYKDDTASGLHRMKLRSNLLHNIKEVDRIE